MTSKSYWLICAVPFVMQIAFAEPPQNIQSRSEQKTFYLHQDDGALTLQQAIDRALQNNPEISIALHEVEANAGLKRQASAIPNPELGYLLEDLHKETRTTTVQLSQPIELGGKRAARMEAAQRGADIADEALRAKRIEIRTEVVGAFYTVLAMQERYRIAQSSLELAERARNIAAKRVAAGKVSPLDETKARVARSAAQVELSQANSDLINARFRLAALLGIGEPDFDTVRGEVDDLPALPAWSTVQAQVGQSPEVIRARLEFERRRALVAVERSKRVGDLTLTIGNKRDETLGRDQTVIGLSIPLPLFDRNQGSLHEALSRSYAANDELTAVRVRAENEIRREYQRLKTAHEEATLYRSEILPDATTAYQAATKGFEYGKFDFIDVLDAQRTLFQAESQYLRSLSEAHIAAAEIERLTGAAGTTK
ncbi:TolC family protein [Oxalicibacterium solurbis]|uniref:Outer membrane protein CzcC n=1 Tax=Oxalicibacterium solurbis TaxID=69280 RepID=A0A8J3AY38_9BURK|nr:TolC family protein [Oxalicibacterium solurbis]GGI55659.1 outer membrane protein CzcC [Oxalicibacterium solurbis]